MADSQHHYLEASHVVEADLSAAHEFHRRRAEESRYLWPRPYAEFEQLVADRYLYVVYEENTIVGLCYVAGDEERRELGGLYVEQSLRGRGVAAAMGRLAIASAFIFDYDVVDAPWDLIAHVHAGNQAPRRVLTEQLGFEDLHESEVPPTEPPANMLRDKQGRVVGDLFRFRPDALAEFADWFERFDGTLLVRDGTQTYLTINDELWTYLSSQIAVLRDLGQQASE